MDNKLFKGTIIQDGDGKDLKLWACMPYTQVSSTLLHFLGVCLLISYSDIGQP